MASIKKNRRITALLGAFDLKAVFEDSYDLEVYFELVNSITTLDLCPAKIEIEFSLKAKRPCLYFPDDQPKLVKVVVPIAKTQDNPKKRLELEGQYFQQYGELVPKMRLSVKSQLAALKKSLTNPEEAKLIDKKVKELRKSGLQKTKLNLKGIN